MERANTYIGSNLRMENISYGKLYGRINNNHMSIKDAIEDIKKSTE